MIKRPREKNEKHLDFIRSLPCVICGNEIETQAAHLRAGNGDFGKRGTGIGEKPSDKWTLPLCGIHHDEQHNGREIMFWRSHNIDPWTLACKLWMVSGDYEAGWQILSLNKCSGKLPVMAR